VRDLNNRGMTVIYTSHYMEEVEYLCRRVGIMDHGRLIALDSIEELKKMAGEKETLETARRIWKIKKSMQPCFCRATCPGIT